MESCSEVRRGWLALGELLIRQWQFELATHIERFLDTMSRQRKEKGQTAIGVRIHARTSRGRDAISR